MARSKKGILDNDISGSVANVVYSSRNGKPYIRAKPAQYRDRKSPAQLASRMKLSMLSGLIKTFKPALDIGFKETPVGKSPRDVAYRANAKDVIRGEYPEMYIHYPEFKVSAGTLDGPQSCETVWNENTLEISWDAARPERGHGDASDRLMLVLYEENKGSLFTEQFISRRSEGQLILELDQRFLQTQSNDSTQPKLHLWLSFTSADARQISDSTYVKIYDI